MTDSIDAKQKLLLEYAISDRAIFSKIVRILKSSYFSNPLDRVCETIVEYFKTHSSPPNPDIIHAETGIDLRTHHVDHAQCEYALAELESFCRRQALTQAIFSSADLLDEDDSRVDEALQAKIETTFREALSVRIDHSMGIDYFEDPEKRVNETNDNLLNYSVGIEAIDKLIGFTHRGELGMFYGVSSGGKSVMLANVAKAFSMQGLDTLVLSLELRDELYAKRMDSIFTSIPIKDHNDRGRRVAEGLEKFKQDNPNAGRIHVKFSPADRTFVSTIRSMLIDYHIMYGKYPDALVVDYLQLMNVEYGKNMNAFDRDHEKSSGLRSIAGEYDMITVSAGQINREGQDVVNVSPAHVAGGMSVINNSDWSIALTASEEDIDNNQVKAVPLKQRNAERTKDATTLYRHPETLVFSETPHNAMNAKLDGTKNAVKRAERENQKQEEEKVKQKVNQSSTKKEKQTKPDATKVATMTRADFVKSILKP